MKVIDPAMAEAPRDGSLASAAKQNLAICLTLYNESVELLQPSLDSIIRGLDELGRSDSTYRRTTICIIADGDAHIPAATRRYLDLFGLHRLQHAPEGLNAIVSERSFLTTDSIGNVHRFRPSPMSITIKLVTKLENAGKLDSHHVFYDVLCPTLDPDYCFQIDAGTLLERESFIEMCALFEADPRTAGLASNVLIEPPEDGNLVQSFQCGDFAVQKTIRWPSEVFSGYLSVLPGQFSAIRWQTFTRSAKQGEPTPKERYLRGQICESAAESMMYLSEDRVLGFELATQRGASNRLGYAPKAVCHTDSCDSISELLLQRRRWLNGSLFCRSWMIGKIVGMFADRSYPFAEKIRFGPALFNLSAQHLLEWFLPLLNILLLAMTWVSLTNVMPSIFTALCVFMPIATVWLMPTFLALSGQIQQWSPDRVQALLRLVSLAFFSVIAINVANLSRQPEMTAYLYYLSMPFALASGAFIGAAILNRAIIAHLRASIVTFISLAPSLWLMMSSYAFFNLHDGSWGTKGLSEVSGAEPSRRANLSDQSRRLRRYLVLAWIASNGAMIAMLVQSGNISTALMVAGTLQIALITSGLLGAISTKLSQTESARKRVATRPTPTVAFAREPRPARSFQRSGSRG